MPAGLPSDCIDHTTSCQWMLSLPLDQRRHTFRASQQQVHEGSLCCRLCQLPAFNMVHTGLQDRAHSTLHKSCCRHVARQSHPVLPPPLLSSGACSARGAIRLPTLRLPCHRTAHALARNRPHSFLQPPAPPSRRPVCPLPPLPGPSIALPSAARQPHAGRLETGRRAGASL